MNGVTFLIVALAAYRVTRLVTLDRISQPAREWLKRRAKRADARLAYLVTCPWCVGMYVSAAAVALADIWTSMPLPVAQWLACSTVVGLMGSRDG